MPKSRASAWITGTYRPLPMGGKGLSTATSPLEQVASRGRGIARSSTGSWLAALACGGLVIASWSPPGVRLLPVQPSASDNR
jgi:hypothetical protein